MEMFQIDPYDPFNIGSLTRMTPVARHPVPPQAIQKTFFWIVYGARWQAPRILTSHIIKLLPSKKISVVLLFSICSYLQNKLKTPFGLSKFTERIDICIPWLFRKTIDTIMNRG